MWSTELKNMQPTEIELLIIEENFTQFSYSIIHLIIIPTYKNTKFER